VSDIDIDIDIDIDDLFANIERTSKTTKTGLLFHRSPILPSDRSILQDDDDDEELWRDSLLMAIDDICSSFVESIIIIC
jgi:hypothetical protein